LGYVHNNKFCTICHKHGKRGGYKWPLKRGESLRGGVVVAHKMAPTWWWWWEGFVGLLMGRVSYLVSERFHFCVCVCVWERERERAPHIIKTTITNALVKNKHTFLCANPTTLIPRLFVFCQHCKQQGIDDAIAVWFLVTCKMQVVVDNCILWVTSFFLGRRNKWDCKMLVLLVFSFRIEEK
jgi:hypothetical protein